MTRTDGPALHRPSWLLISLVGTVLSWVWFAWARSAQTACLAAYVASVTAIILLSRLRHRAILVTIATGAAASVQIVLWLLADAQVGTLFALAVLLAGVSVLRSPPKLRSLERKER